MPHLRLAVGLALALAAPGLAAPTPIPVTGWVMDAQGKPLAGARVTLSPLPSAFERQKLAIASSSAAPEPAQKATSDAAGSFTLAARDSGMWLVRLEAAGAVPVEIELLPLVEDQELPPFPTALAQDVGVEVRVVDGQGRPVPGVRVGAESMTLLDSLESWRPAIRRGETGPDGRLRLPRMRGERLKIRARASGYPVTEIESGEAKVLLRLSPAPPRTVLVRGADGSPVAGALVATGAGSPAATLTDEQGRATVFAEAGKKLRPVAWTADGRRGVAGIAAGNAAKPATPAPEADPAAPLSILLPRPPERMSGQVVDRLDRQPLAGALVWPRQDPAAWVRADAKGGYALPPAPEGRTLLAAAAPNHLSEEVRVPPAGRGERTLRAPTFALEPTAAAEGLVVDPAGKPVAGAQVSAAVPASLFDWTAPKARARSGLDGRFSLRPLATARPYEVTASLPGFVATKLTLAELQPKAVRSGLRLVLRRGRTVRGRVVDGAGQPVAAAAVQLVAPAGAAPLREGIGNSRQATADATGQFAFEGLSPGKIDLFVRTPGFPPASRRQVAIPAGAGSFDLGPITLGKGVSLAGIVVDRAGLPVAGAVVRAQAEQASLFSRLSRAEGDETSTGADGRFAVSGLSTGPVVVTVEREGFASRTLTGVKPPLPEPLRIALAPAARLAGEVVDEDGAPVAGARVRARSDARISLGSFSPAATTDDDGHFELRDPPTGKLSLSTLAADFLSAIQPVELAEGERRDNLRIILHRGATVAGRVLGPDGTPAAGAEVSLAAQGQGRFVGPAGTSTRADGDGAYVLDAVPPGPRTFTAQLPGAAPTVRDLAVRPGENRLDFQLGPGLEVAGRVVDPAGTPVGGARVSLSAGDFQPHDTASGDDGSFRFPGLRGGAYRLSARAEGFASASQEVKLAEASLQGIELRLGSGGAVAGHILGLSPEQLAQVTVRASRAGSEPGGQWSEPDAQGEYRISDLPPGDWTVIALLGGRSATGKVQLLPGAPEVRLDLEFPSGLTLSGHLRRAGQPASGAYINAKGLDVETHGSGQSDTQGAFRIEGLKAGTYEVTVSTLAAGQVHKETLELTADREADIELPAAEVRGKVVDADDGSPIAEAAVSLEPVQADGLTRARPWGRVLTGPDGAFVLEGGAEGDYRVVARKDLYAPAEAPIHLAGDRGVDDVKLSMTLAKGLRFTVRDSTGSSPGTVSAALLDPAGRVLLAGSYPVSDGGRVRISEAPAGHWLLLVAAGNTATATAAVDVPGPRAAILLPDPTHLTVLVPELVGRPAGATLQITGADGLPYRSLRFGFLFPEPKLADGRLELDDLPPGTWRLRVAVPGGKVREGTAVTAPGVPSQAVLK